MAAINQVLKAKRKFEQQMGHGSHEGEEDRNWMVAISNTQKMFSVAQELWLTLNAHGEACLRVAVELICDHKTRKIILQQTEKHTDQAIAQMEKISREKLKSVFNQLRPGEGERYRTALLERKAKERAEADAKTIAQLREELDHALYRAASLEKEVKAFRNERDAEDRRNLREGSANESLLAQQLKVQMQQMKELKKNYAEFEDTLQTLRDEAAAAKRESEDLRGLNDVLNQSNRDLERRLDQAEKSVKVVSPDGFPSPEELADLRAVCKKLSVEKEELNKKVFALERALKDKECVTGNVGQDCEKCKELMNQLAKVRAQSQLLQGKVDSMVPQEELQSVQAQVESLKVEVESLRVQLQEAQASQAGAVAERKVEGAVGGEVEGNLTEERNKWAKERARLLEENAALQATEHELRAALDELQLRLMRLSELGKRSPVASAMQELLHASGLTSCIEGGKPKKVWDRLYNDFWERMKRLEEARQRAREAKEQAEVRMPSRSACPWMELFDEPQGLTVSDAVRGPSPRAVSREPLLGPRPHKLVSRPAIGMAEKPEWTECINIQNLEMTGITMQDPSPMKIRLRPPRLRPDRTPDRGQDKGLPSLEKTPDRVSEIIDQMHKSVGISDLSQKPYGILNSGLQRSQICFQQPAGWSPRDAHILANGYQRSQSCMRGVGSNSRESSRETPLRKSGSESQIDDAFRIQPRPGRRPRFGHSPSQPGPLTVTTVNHELDAHH